ncbi:hypothetical protein OHT93_19950 [Streptomyces sp. NBC_00191]|uniref:hypothetical protein n=1 Tax=Streptomyces sp. NBC_00191 TaxID=2975674 RepID=UPI0032465934
MRGRRAAVGSHRELHTGAKTDADTCSRAHAHAARAVGSGTAQHSGGPAAPAAVARAG